MEHQKKTRQSQFLRDPAILFLPEFAVINPKRLDFDGILRLCPAEVYCEFNCRLTLGETNVIKCRECRKEFWTEEVDQ